MMSDAAAGADDDAAALLRILASIRVALTGVDNEKEGQELNIHIVDNMIMDAFNAQYIVDFLELHPRAVNKLVSLNVVCLIFLQKQPLSLLRTLER
jgi:hypothetical protein